MKTIRTFFILIVLVSASPLALHIGAADWESYELINRLLAIREPGEPVIYENYVIFTADSGLRRVGVAFAHENFSSTYWFRQLLVYRDRLELAALPEQKNPDPYKDSGLQFHVYQIPEYLRELEYRLVINGLWTVDPLNPRIRRDPISGLSMSVLHLPSRPVTPNPLNGLPEGLTFSFKGPPGETVSVAGSFNGWDPFMYELKEGPAGLYSITIPLPPGTYQYVFFHRGQRHVDPYNPRRIYARDGSAASELVVR